MTAASTSQPLGRLAREGVVFHDLDRSTLQIEGPDRAAWLNGVITQQAPTEGRAAYGLALSRPGKVQADVYCLEVGDRILVATPRAAHEALLATWQRMLVMEDAELGDASSEHAWLLAIGPQSSQVLFEGTPSGELDVLGLGGRLHAVSAKAPLPAGASPRLDAADWLELRLERRFPEFGVDYSEQDRPHEASLDRLAVSWTKGCYLGQEVVCMQEMRGKVKRRLELLVAPAPLDPLPEAGAPVIDAGGETVGHVTSAANSRRLGCGLLMARLSVAAQQAELRLSSGESLRVSDAL